MILKRCAIKLENEKRNKIKKTRFCCHRSIKLKISNSIHAIYPLIFNNKMLNPFIIEYKTCVYQISHIEAK